jgi:hypothetical protein
MMYKHWSERDPIKLQQKIREEEARFRSDHAPLIKAAEEGVEQCFSEWHKLHPELKLVKWSIAKNYPNFDEMMADEEGFPKKTKFSFSMGFRLQNYALTAGLEIGFASAPTIETYKELKKSLAVLFEQINQKKWPKPNADFPTPISIDRPKSPHKK